MKQVLLLIVSLAFGIYLLKNQKEIVTKILNDSPPSNRGSVHQKILLFAVRFFIVLCFFFSGQMIIELIRS